MDQIKSRSGPPEFPVASAAGLLIPVLLLACLTGWASPEGSISGKVVDPSEAVIPGVSVVICNVETGVRQTTITNSDGFYSLPALPPGRYPRSGRGRRRAAVAGRGRRAGGRRRPRLAAALPGARFLPALRRGNVLGALDMGLAPGVLPGRVILDEGREWFDGRPGAGCPPPGTGHGRHPGRRRRDQRRGRPGDGRGAARQRPADGLPRPTPGAPGARGGRVRGRRGHRPR